MAFLSVGGYFWGCMWSSYGASGRGRSEQVKYVYHCCLCLIFDQTTMAQEQFLINVIF